MALSPPASDRGKSSEALVSSLLQSHGWTIASEPVRASRRPDLIIQRRRQRFAVEIKSLSEGRADRAIPLLSQAILQAQAYARDARNAQPLAVICVDNASAPLLKQVRSFAEDFAPDAALGVVSKNGLRYFRGAAFEELNAEPHEQRKHKGHRSPMAINLFSDLNQWMLKVLLAAEIPDALLQAPRGKYRNGTELAQAALVSNMSASRFLQQLRHERFLDDASGSLGLVRRAELFRRWRAAVMRPTPELPMRFLIKGSVQQQLRRLVATQQGEACLGLFAAADALQLGHVSGVPPYVYVPKLPRPGEKKWAAVVVASPGEMPDLIVRQAPSPNAIFRAAVHRDDLLVADVIQTWLDVAHHPSRGEEQADLIYKKLLQSVITADPR